MQRLFMRKLTILLLCLLLVGSLSACASQTQPEQPTKPSTEKPAETPQATPPKPAAEEIAAYLPLQVGNKWEYAGSGNEFAAYTQEVTYQEGNKYQVMIASGTVMANRYEVREDMIVKTYQEPEVYDNKNILAEPSNVHTVLLKKPLTVGTAWTNGENNYEIIATDAEVETPAGTFQDCLAVKVSYPAGDGYTVYYYKKGVGMVRSDYRSKEGLTVTSALEKYTVKP